MLKELAIELNCREDMVGGKVKNLQVEVKKLMKELKSVQQKSESNKSQALFDEVTKSGDYAFKIAEVPEAADLKSMSDYFVDKHKNGVLALYSKRKDRLSLLIRTNKANKNISCSKILSLVLSTVGGKGGGRPDMAQGSGDFPSDLQKFNKDIEKILMENLK
jgi:alanyl-tRNA synthetase